MKEEYFKCPVCGKKVLKRKGIKLIWSTICEECFDKIFKDHEEIRKKGNDVTESNSGSGLGDESSARNSK
jgi:ribosomal protein L37AE/L43A